MYPNQKMHNWGKRGVTVSRDLLLNFGTASIYSTAQATNFKCDVPAAGG